MIDMGWLGIGLKGRKEGDLWGGKFRLLIASRFGYWESKGFVGN
jgi:hypothetical protein